MANTKGKTTKNTTKNTSRNSSKNTSKSTRNKPRKKTSKRRKQEKKTKQILISILFLIVFTIGYLWQDNIKEIVDTYFPHFFENVSESVDGSICKVHFIDVGQGDSILIESEGSYMLIDTGEKEYANSLINYLNSLDIKQLDYIVATHPHSDHIGGFTSIIDSFPINSIIMPTIVHTTATYENLIDSIIDHNITVIDSIPGKTITLGNAKITIIAPVADYGNDLNNWSVGLRVVYGNNSLILCGDAEDKAITDILAAGYSLDADIVKLSHHGSKTSKKLLNATFTYAIINCSVGNIYSFPHEEIMEKLKEKQIKLFRTDLQGTVVAYLDGTNIGFNMEPSNNYKTGKEVNVNH